MPAAPPIACEVREADAIERRLAVWLLPQAVASPLDPHVLVAVSPDGRRLLGVAAVACTVPADDPPGVPCAVHVVEGERGRGIGRSLLAGAEALARHWGVPNLASWEPAEQGGEAAAGWARLGFTPHRTLRRFRCSAEALLGVVGPVWDRLREHGSIPPGTRVAPIGGVPREQVLRLQSMHLGGRPEAVAAALDAGRYCPHGSVAIVLPDGRLAGIVLARWTDEQTISVDSKVVAPGVRGSWVNAALMAEGLRGAGPKGLAFVTFEAGERHRDTARLAERAGGVCVLTLERHVRPVAPGGA